MKSLPWDKYRQLDIVERVIYRCEALSREDYKKLDDDDIREHARTIGSFAAEYIKEGFTKRGVKAAAALL